MKKILIVVVALFVVNGAFSQVKFGVKTGVNLSSVSGLETSAGGFSVKIAENDGMSFGFHAGVFANISLNERFGLQPELLFSRQGGKHKASSELSEELEEMGMDIESARSTYTFDYINLPILLEFKPVANLGILVGPQFGLNISKSETSEGITISGSDLDDLYKEELGLDKSPFQSFDVSLVLGVQYTLIERLTVGLRYNFGLTNAFNVSVPIPGTGISADAKGLKNNVIQLSAGYSF